jgi:histidinol dehydrogenase
MAVRDVLASQNPGTGDTGPELVYPVYSRRSGGLSLGINLFPEGKRCNFDCPYCEIFPYAPGPAFSMELLVDKLAGFFKTRREVEFPGTPVLDICLAGRGEPTLSPSFGAALDAARAARDEFCPEAKLVLITNSTGFACQPVMEALERFTRKGPLTVWAKLDAGTELWYRTMNRTPFPLEDILRGLERYAAAHPVTIQTMVCRVNGALPANGEIAAYASRLVALLDAGADIEEIQIYTQARPSPEGITSMAEDWELLDIAQRVRETTDGRVKVRTFGSGS